MSGSYAEMTKRIVGIYNSHVRFSSIPGEMPSGTPNPSTDPDDQKNQLADYLVNQVAQETAEDPDSVDQAVDSAATDIESYFGLTSDQVKVLLDEGLRESIQERLRGKK